MEQALVTFRAPSGVLSQTGLTPFTLLPVGELEQVKKSDDLLRQHQAHKLPNIVDCIRGEFIMNPGAVVGGIINIDGSGGTGNGNGYVRYRLE